MSGFPPTLNHGILTKRMSGNNDLGALYRNQATTDRYRQFRAQCHRDQESVVQFIIKKRLGWISEDGQIDTMPRSRKLFTDQRDVKIIENDFPYHFDKSVTHIVCWSRAPILCDPESPIGDVSPWTRLVIDAFVRKNFPQESEEGRLLWFRNFPSLQSVAELSHVHLLVKDLSGERHTEVLGVPCDVLRQEELDELEELEHGTRNCI